jgi:hypothetical protein
LFLNALLLDELAGILQVAVALGRNAESCQESRETYTHSSLVEIRRWGAHAVSPQHRNGPASPGDDLLDRIEASPFGKPAEHHSMGLDAAVRAQSIADTVCFLQGKPATVERCVISEPLLHIRPTAHHRLRFGSLRVSPAMRETIRPNYHRPNASGRPVDGCGANGQLGERGSLRSGVPHNPT